MNKASRRSAGSRPARRTVRAQPTDSRAALASWWASGPAALVVAAIAFVIVRPGGSLAALWIRLGNEDVHSLAFVGDDPNRLLFGHHGRPPVVVGWREDLGNPSRLARTR